MLPKYIKPFLWSYCSDSLDKSKDKKIKTVFYEHQVLKTQEEKNTLSVFIDNHIKLSFFTFEYKLVGKSVNDEYFRLASISDIACMKFSAITSRARSRDYIDLYFILRANRLEDLLMKCAEKMAVTGSPDPAPSVFSLNHCSLFC